MIRDAREPRNTRAAGAAELEPTTSTSPSRHSTSSRMPGRTDDDHGRPAPLGHVEQARRRGPRVVHHGGRGHVIGQLFPCALERVSCHAVEKPPVLAVLLRRLSREWRRDDGAQDEIVVRRAGQHPGEVQDGPATPIRRVPDHERHTHDVIPGVADRTPAWGLSTRAPARPPPPASRPQCLDVRQIPAAKIPARGGK